MGYKLEKQDPGQDLSTELPPVIMPDDEGTTSWRDAKKALRQWYLDQAKALRSVSEKDYFPE